MKHERIASPRGLLPGVAGLSLSLVRRGGGEPRPFGGGLLALTLTLAVAPIACISAPEAEPEVRQDLFLSPELLPTPYSAAEIRDGNGPGTSRTYLVVSDGEVGLERTTFLEHPEGLARFRSERRDLEGTSLGEPAEGEAPWDALQRHASYPRAEATRSDSICTTAAGRFDAWLYDWRQPARDGQPAARHRVWFAKDRPGPPVLYETTVDGELVFRMELIKID